MAKPKVALGVAALLISAALLALMSPSTGEAQIGSTPVRVVNTPLPVTGSVNATVTGSVNAAVTGSVDATITGAVPLAPGTIVNVGNTAAEPVPVREVGGTGQLTRGFGGCFFASFVCMIDIATVPLGQRLVIRHISGNINVFADTIQNVVVGRAFLNCCLASNDDYLVPQRMGGSDRLGVNHETLMFFDGGETVRIFIEKGSGAGSVGAANFSYTGDLIAN